MSGSADKTIAVLLIEDDPDIIDIYVDRFKLDGGFEVKTAQNGKEGLAALQGYTPDIILLDMMMPTMSGIETLQHIRELDNGAPYKVIALTNMDDPDITKEIAKYKVLDHIVKANTSPSKLMERIKQLLQPSV